MDSSATEIRLWISRYRNAQIKEQQLLCDSPLAPEKSWERAARLIAFAREFSREKTDPSDKIDAEDMEGYRRWARLRKRLAVK